MIYGYIRVSTDQQDNENQKLGVNSKAKQLGFEVDEWIADDGVSGAKEPEDRLLGKLLAKIQKDDIIISSEISRLGRKLFMVMRILEHCMKVGAKVYTVKDGYELGDNIQSKVLAFAFGLAAEIERNMISLRTTEALVQKRKIGVLLGNKRGCRHSEYLNERDLERMRIMLEKGYSLVKIAKEMNVHRITAGYYLQKSGLYHGQIKGYKLTYANGNTIELTKRNCTDYGLYYKHIQDAVLNKKNLSQIGIVNATPIHGDISIQIRDYFNVSEHAEINHDEIEMLIKDNLTIPEIHSRINEVVEYDVLYDYIQNDTGLSSKYREKGHLKVKSKRDRY